MDSTKRILVVDDSEFDRELIMRALHQRGGYETIGAKNGVECVKIRDVFERQEIEYKQYVGLTSMLNLNKKAN